MIRAYTTENTVFLYPKGKSIFSCRFGIPKEDVTDFLNWLQDPEGCFLSPFDASAFFQEGVVKFEGGGEFSASVEEVISALS